MNKRFSDVGVNRMRPEVPVGIVVGVIAAVWKSVQDGTSWESLGLFLIVSVLIEWVGSIFLQRSHDITKHDIYLQAQRLREQIRGFDDEN